MITREQATDHFHAVAERVKTRRAQGLADDHNDKIALFFSRLLDDVDDVEMVEFCIMVAEQDMGRLL